MSQVPSCVQCHSEYPYEDRGLWVCPQCGHEWPIETQSALPTETVEVIRDANGNILADGDSVSVIKDLKVKGSSSVIKVGTKAKNIRLILDADDGHNIDCKLEGFGAMTIKSEFVKKL